WQSCAFAAAPQDTGLIGSCLAGCASRPRTASQLPPVADGGGTWMVPSHAYRGGVAAVLSSLLLASVPALAGTESTGGTLHDPRETRLAEVRQLTFGGENAEAYWSFSGERLSFQSTRPPYECDQIFTMPALEAGEAQLVSTGTGRTTCAHYLPGDQRI